MGLFTKTITEEASGWQKLYESLVTTDFKDQILAVQKYVRNIKNPNVLILVYDCLSAKAAEEAMDAKQFNMELITRYILSQNAKTQVAMWYRYVIKQLDLSILASIHKYITHKLQNEGVIRRDLVIEYNSQAIENSKDYIYNR